MPASSSSIKASTKPSNTSAKQSQAAVKTKTTSEDAGSFPFSLPSNKHLLMIKQKEDFHAIITEVGDRVIMFEFFAPWCGPCKMLTNKLEDMALQYEGKLLIVKIDVDEFEDLALEHNVTAMPTFMIMQNKRVLQKFSSSNAEHLQVTVEKYAGKPSMKGDDENNVD